MARHSSALSDPHHPWRSHVGDAFGGRVALVTGASGFLGWHLSTALDALGAITYRVSRNVARDAGAPEDRQLGIDVTDAQAVRAAVVNIKPDFVFHLAGLSTASEDRSLVLPTLQVNLCGTVNLLQAVADAGCRRIVLVCSAEEARAATGSSVPASPYGASKTAMALYGRMFHRLYGVPVVMIRPMMAYGPRQGQSKLIPYVIRSLLRNESPRLTNGMRACDFVYVDDVVRAFLMAATAEGVLGDTFDIGTGESTRIRDLVQLLTAIVPSSAHPEFGALPDRVEDPMGATDHIAARQRLGFEAAWTLKDGLHRTVEYYARELGAVANTT
jgi:nucleoside-diphosphate-sugar epimerase